MKVRVKEHTITALNNLKNLWLLRGNDILIIKDFEYVVEKPNEPSENEIPTLPNTVVRKKKRFGAKDDTPKIYVTKMVIAGYHPDLKFVGTYNEDYCTRLLESHDDNHYNFSLIDCRKDWMKMKEQIDALTEDEK